jgi:hypothetical protein
MRRSLLITLAVFVCGFLLSPSATAQTINGSISGVVTDTNGAAIAGATVTATNAGNGQSRDAITNDEGLYRISSLAIGTYSVKIEKSGFGAATEETRVSAGANTEVNFKLSAGTLQAQVQVTDTGAILETTQSKFTNTIDKQKIL